MALVIIMEAMIPAAVIALVNVQGKGGDVRKDRNKMYGDKGCL